MQSNDTAIYTSIDSSYTDALPVGLLRVPSVFYPRGRDVSGIFPPWTSLRRHEYLRRWSENVGGAFYRGCPNLIAPLSTKIVISARSKHLGWDRLWARGRMKEGVVRRSALTARVLVSRVRRLR